jgi:hypothetical protein
MGYVIFGVIFAIPVGLLFFALVSELRKDPYEKYWQDVLKGLGIYLVCLLLCIPVVAIITLVSFNLPYIIKSIGIKGRDLISVFALILLYMFGAGAIGILEFYLWIGYKKGQFRRHMVRATITECIVLSLTYLFHLFLNFDVPI